MANFGDMRGSFLVLLIGLLGLCHRSLADDCTNVTIANAADAEAVRKSCPVIQGDLTFMGAISESINLDGVETVLGGILHDGACGRTDDECPHVQPFTISSSTLTTVNQTIDFRYFPGLEKLILPNLTTVNSGLMLRRLHDLTHLDITGLSYVGWVLLETTSLKTLLLDGLKGFTGTGSNGYVALWDAGQVESVDGFFKNPIDPVFYPETSQDSSLSTNAAVIPNIRKITIGWTRIPKLSLSGQNLTVVLGGPSTKSMEIDMFEVGDGVVDLQRSPELKNLTLTTFSMDNNRNMTHLKADFDQVANFAVYGYPSLRTLELPPQAVNWANLSMRLTQDPSGPLNFSSEYTVDASGQKQRTWYWPEKDMREVVVHGNIATDFFQSFLEYRIESKDPSSRPRVLETFDIRSDSPRLKLNCSVFDELQNKTGVLPANYSCSYKSAAALAQGYVMRQPWQFGLLALGLSISFL